jgi:hypothetical protein
MKRYTVLLLVGVLLALVLASAGGAAAGIVIGPEGLHPGVSDRGYLLSADDAALYGLYAPRGMVARPRIEVDPASALRVKARIDMYPTVLIDDDCNEAIVEFNYVASDVVGDLIIEPCPGALDIDTPFFVSFNYEPTLLEQEPNEVTSNEIWLDQSGVLLTYEGSIDPADDLDRYRIDASQLFLWTGGEHIGQPLRVTMTQRNSNVQPWLTLLGPNTQIDATSCGSQPATACIEVTPTEYGDYRIYARGVSGQGGYSLTFDLLNIAGEPNDSTGMDGNIYWGLPHTGAIDPVGDVEYGYLASVYSPPWEAYGDQVRILRVSFNFDAAFTLPHLAVDVINPNGTVIYSDVLSASHPSFDFMVPQTPNGQYYLRLSDADNGTGDPNAIFYRGGIEWVGPYVSSDLDGLGGRFARKQGDLLYQANDHHGFYWNLAFDASDVGITQDVSAAEFLPNGSLLLALGAAQTVPGLGKVNPQDIIRFVPSPAGLGESTYGVFEWYIDGSDIGLTTAGEKIDAIALTSTDPDNFAIAVSLSGSGSVPKTAGGNLAVADEDLIRLNSAQFGANTTGSWSLFTDGSALPGMAAENLNGATLIAPPAGTNPGGQWLWLIKASFNIDDFSGDARDVLNVWRGATPTSLEALGLTPNNLGDKRLDAITVGPPLDD